MGAPETHLRLIEALHRQTMVPVARRSDGAILTVTGPASQPVVPPWDRPA
jgi:hypothetical protein